jgi:alkanesulfonate monooxygenase SsuD/methylene tetrahydromethanopterin reductase-like flavin-dependent oxidoreductase (luciferase family)
VEIGIGLDPTLGLNYEQQAQISAEAARLGYRQVWTPAGSGEDSFHLCHLRWAATRDIVPGGVTTGIGVFPVAVQSPFGFAASAGTLSKITGGRFILGIGSGQADLPRYRQSWGLRGNSTISLMRDYLTTIRTLLRGEPVDYESDNVSLHGARLSITPAQQTPVYLGALGPQMLRLGGECADGLCLNWCTSEQVARSREVVAEGAARAGRDPAEVKIAEYIRICVDDDVEVARRAYARSMMSYAVGNAPPGTPARSYRANFERMGFAADLARIDDMRRGNAPQEEIVDAIPPAMCLAVGYFGKPEGAAGNFSKLAQGLDIAIVRVVNARPGIDSTRAVMEACAPGA